MIREAEIKDRDEIQKLYEVLCPDRPIRVLEERIKEIKQNMDNFLFVFEQDGKILGTTFLTICLDPMLGFQPYGVVENIIVNSEYRGKGIGTAILDKIGDVCRSRNCSEIMLQSNYKRIDAHRFFERSGYSSDICKGFKKYLNLIEG